LVDLAGDGAQSPEFIKLAGAAADGVVASSPGVPLAKMPGGKGFTERFNAKYGQIQIYAPYAYDAVMTLVDAMQKANSTQPAKYLPELARITREGVTGPIAFDERGDLKGGPITLYVVKRGKWDTLETVGGSVHTERRASISVAKPIVRLYERDQLLGILFERALSGTFALRREETTVEAFPFFFSTRARDAGLSYEWRLGGARLEGKTDPSVLLRQVGATGQTNLSVNVSGFDTVLESAKSSVGIDFGR